MKLKILNKVFGSGSAPARDRFAFLALVKDIEVFPKTDSLGVLLMGDIKMKENCGMMQIYLTASSQEYSYDIVGESDSKSFKVKFNGTHPGTEQQALEFATNFLEEEFVVLIPQCNKGIKVLGSPDSPLIFTSSHKSAKDSEKFNFVFEQEVGSEQIYLLYDGLITLNTNIDIDMNDFLELLKGYIKIDGSNLTDTQKQNLKNILGLEGNNISNSDLSLNENRSFNLKNFFLNFFSNVGLAKVGINKNNPTQALEVVGNIKTDGLVLAENGTPSEVGSIKRSGNEIQFKTSAGWETIMLKGDYVSDSHGVISPDTQAPVGGWKIGWYTPRVSSPTPGTNYPNQDNLKSVEGFFTEFYFDGNIWTDVSNVIDGSLDLDVAGGALSFEVGKGDIPIPSGALVPQWVQKNPTLNSSYFAYNNSTSEVTEISFASFRSATFTAQAGERIRIKIGNFYIQNNGNGINPNCIWIKDLSGNLIYNSKGELESGISVPSGEAATGTFQFERDITVDCIIGVCSEFVNQQILEISVRENVATGDYYILNTSKADIPGGYVSFDNYIPGGIVSNPYENKMHRIAGDSISELLGVNAPTTTKYWYSYLSEYLGMNHKTYAQSGNQWTDVYNQLVQMKADEVSTGIKTDLITIFAGTNDYFFNTPIGEMYTIASGVRSINVNDTTFKGRINKALNYARRNFPTAQIIVCNILHRGTFQSSASELTPNGIGVFLDEYSKAIDEATQLWSMALINLRGESTLYPVPEMSSFYKMGTNNDMLHPNERGHQRIAQLIKTRLLSLPIEINLP